VKEGAKVVVADLNEHGAKTVASTIGPIALAVGHLQLGHRLGESTSSALNALIQVRDCLAAVAEALALTA
jgi:hypothetical protein